MVCNMFAKYTQIIIKRENEKNGTTDCHIKKIKATEVAFTFASRL